MAKYKNISQFVKPLVINGKRVIVNPNDIVFSERELDTNIYDFLQKVDDKVQVSQIKEIVKKQIVVTKPEEVKKIKTSLEEVKKEVSTLQATPKEISELTEKMNSIIKKLDIMKNAIEQMDATVQEVSAISQEANSLSQQTAKELNQLATEVYENGGLVITGLDDENPEQQKG